MDLKITGVVKWISPNAPYSPKNDPSKTLNSINVLIEEINAQNPAYPGSICVRLQGKNYDNLISMFKVSNILTVSLNATAYPSKDGTSYFNSFSVWKAEMFTAQQQAGGYQQPVTPQGYVPQPVQYAQPTPQVAPQPAPQQVNQQQPSMFPPPTGY